ncbi:MAG: nucleoside monophosphate kinase [Clostridiales bacterium]|nr:nucleoside monophosphate kinase [Clostridiales bacterium]
MNIILIGIQGCGKGTLVTGLEKHIDFDLISIGQLLRDEVMTGSELGKHIKECQNNGVLVEIETVLAAINKKLATSTKEIAIFDGFPRNELQADKFNEISKVDLVIHLHLSKEIALKRLLNRLTCEKCGFVTTRETAKTDVCPECSGKLVQRWDDTLESIEKRFATFEKETYPLLEKYRKQGVKVVDIESIDKDTTLNAVLKVLNEYNY